MAFTADTLREDPYCTDPTQVDAEETDAIIAWAESQFRDREAIDVTHHQREISDQMLGHVSQMAVKIALEKTLRSQRTA